MRTKIGAALVFGLMSLVACDDPTGVPAMDVATVSVAPGGRTLVTGETMQLMVYPKTSDGTVLGGRFVAWSSEAEDVATVSANGMVLAAGPGTTTIRATVEGKVGSVQVSVVAAPLEVAGIEILNAPQQMEIGQQIMLEAVLKAADGTVIGGRTIAWRTSHGPTATVNVDPNSSFALLSAHAAGSVVITAEAAGRSVSVAVTVGPPATVGSIVIHPSDADVWVGGNRTYEATVLTPTGERHPNPPAIAWSADDQTVATVDAQGRVLGVRSGTTTIRATIGGVQAGALLTVHAVLTGRQIFTLDGTRDPAGASREVILGTLTWYGDSNEGEEAVEILKSGSLTLETAGGVTTYGYIVYFDVVVVDGGNARKVAFGSISDSGTVETLYDHTGDEPGLRFTSSKPEVQSFMARLEAAERLIVRQAIGTAALLEYHWERE